MSDTYFSVSGRSVTAAVDAKARQLVQRHRSDCRRRRRAVAGRRWYAERSIANTLEENVKLPYVNIRISSLSTFMN